MAFTYDEHERYRIEDGRSGTDAAGRAGRRRIAMAKAVAIPESSNKPQPHHTNEIVGTWDRWVGFLKDTRNEMRKVWTPSLKEVQNTTAVVIVTVFAFAAYFYVVDQVIGRGMQWLLHLLGGNGM
jgi:preprotein translocase subunit SecE